MVWKDVCVRGHRAGGLVREDDPHGSEPKLHDAGGPSPGIERFIRDVVRTTPVVNEPEKPENFPVWVKVETYPGQNAADVHFEGRAADIYLSFDDAAEKTAGNWLFDWCVTNCISYKIQGVIFGPRKWYSEMKGGVVQDYTGGDHNNHVHVELNCDGAALTTTPPELPGGLVGTWDVTIGDWSGIFVFGSDHSASWADNPRSRQTPGSWVSDGDNVYFQFHAPGDYRFFQVTLPVNSEKTTGTIFPAGQGRFEMTKRGFG
jgi:hypothetical protein